MTNNEKSRKKIKNDITDLSNEQILKFLPSNFPKLYQDGRIPLRVQIFNDKKILQSVISKPKKGVYMCNHCNTSFANLGSILDHFDEFDIKRPFKCTVEDCPWKVIGFNKSRQLQRHTASVHSEREFKCQVLGCERMFKRMDLLSRHTKSVHQNLSSRFNKKLVKNSPLLNQQEIKPNEVPKKKLIKNKRQKISTHSYKHSINFLTNHEDE